MTSPFRIADTWRRQIPAYTADVLERYVNHGPAALSSFHFRLLSGDAFGAACVADLENRAALGALLELIASEFPGDCYGSPETVQNWRGSLNGGAVETLDVPLAWTLTVEELRREGPQGGTAPGKRPPTRPKKEPN